LSESQVKPEKRVFGAVKHHPEGIGHLVNSDSFDTLYPILDTRFVVRGCAAVSAEAVREATPWDASRNTHHDSGTINPVSGHFAAGGPS